MTIGGWQSRRFKTGCSNSAAEFESGVFDSLFQGRLVHIVLVVPFHTEFLAGHVGDSGFHTV